MTDPTNALGSARRVTGPGGILAVELALRNGARAAVTLHGGHVVSYVPAAGAPDALYLSPRTETHDRASIRGGVPVIFPQFAAMGPLPKHGFARTRSWDLLRTEGPDVFSGEMTAVLGLRDDAETRAIWPHEFFLTLRVTLGPNSLRVRLDVSNTGDAPLRFTAALHTYFRVADVRRARVEGLTGLRYLDAAGGKVERVDDQPAVTFPGEVDRVYYGATRPLRLVDAAAGGRVVGVESDFGDVVVWNPGPALAATLRDLGEDEATRMLCVEAARVGEPVELAPGENWSGHQLIRPE